LKVGGAVSLALTATATVGNAAASDANVRPNILVVITDQQHIDTIAAGGCDYILTPALDKLKNRGISFTQSYSPNPVCSPARSAIFTGRTTTETSVYVNGKSIRSDIPNLGQWFSEQTDYETLYAGKWHVPHSYQNTIEGFTVLHTGIGGQGNLGDTATSRACAAYLRNRATDRPFLMVASFMQPHDICEWLRLNTENPGQLRYPELVDQLPPLPDNFEFDTREPAYIKETRRTRGPAKGGWDDQQWRFYRWSYYRHVEMLDGEVGRVLQALEDTGQDRNTLILFTADHGEGLGHHQMVRKSSPYDEASKVPMLVSLPERILENRTDTTHLVSGLDVVPTLCDYAGIEPPPNMRGASIRPLLEGRATSWHDYIVTEMPGNRARLVRTERYKYVSYADDPVDQLYDMQNDPGETENLAADPRHAKIVAEHRELLRQWESRLDVTPDLPHADAWWRTS
jgi:choline-sulfatase